MIDVAKIKRRAADGFIGAYIDRDLRTWVRNWCRENSTSVSALVRELLDEFRRTHR